MHILFAGGGTAGHVNPALSVADYINKNYKDVKISYIGTAKGIESRLVPAAGFDFYTINASGFQRSISFNSLKRNIVAVYDAVSGSVKARKLIKELKPDVVVGTGGYVSGPVLSQAAKLGVKTAIHEQNAYPGVTTKMLIPLVDKVMLAMPDAKKRLKADKEYIITGNPIRENVMFADREEARKKLGLGNKKFVLSFGGSLGARAINNAALTLCENAIKHKDFYFYHATGKINYRDFLPRFEQKGYNENIENVKIFEYINNMDELMAAADLIICRAGAITLGELQACGKPSILIPSPYVAENHQYFNALTLKNDGAAELIEEKDLNGDLLLEKVLELIADDEKLSNMSKCAKMGAIIDSNKRIAEVVVGLIKGDI